MDLDLAIAMEKKKKISGVTRYSQAWVLMLILLQTSSRKRGYLKKKEISCYILVHTPKYLFIYLESPCSLCFFLLKRKQEIIQIERKIFHTLNSSKDWELVNWKKKNKHKPQKCHEQLCVNIWWYAGSKLQSEVFALFFLTLTNIT